MLTLRFIGFLSAFRKHNVPGRRCRGLAGPVIFMAFFSLLALGFSVLAVSTNAAAAQNGDEEEPGIIYHGRDAEGNRIFGTDHKSGARFYTDPQSGDRHFGTAPPDPSASGNSGGPEYIFVSPEVYVDHNGQPNRSNYQRPSDRGRYQQNQGGENKSGEKPILRPEDRPPRNGPSSIPSRGSWWRHGKHPAYDRPPTGGSFSRHR